MLGTAPGRSRRTCSAVLVWRRVISSWPMLDTGLDATRLGFLISVPVTTIGVSSVVAAGVAGVLWPAAGLSCASAGLDVMAAPTSKVEANRRERYRLSMVESLFCPG